MSTAIGALPSIRERTFTTLSPAELEKASGLSTELQRVWRRRGELSQREGNHARFTAKEAAAVSIAVALTKFGHLPARAIRIGREYAPVVIRCALLRGGMCEIIGSKEDVRTFRTAFDDDVALGVEIAGDEKSQLKRFLFSLENETPRLSEVGLESIEDDAITMGYFINLEALAFRLVSLLERPFVTFKLGDQEPHDPIKSVI